MRWGRIDDRDRCRLVVQGAPVPGGDHRHCVWLYHRFPLSFREVEELMLERGVDRLLRDDPGVVRQVRAGLREPAAPPAAPARRQVAPRRGVHRRSTARQQYLWRAVDQDGNVLDILVQPRRDAKAAKRFFRRLLKRQCAYVPRVIVTDKLRQLPGGAPRGDALGRAPAVEVPEQPGRELPPADPATRTGDETLHARSGTRNGSCPRSAASRRTSGPAATCCRRPTTDR